MEHRHTAEDKAAQNFGMDRLHEHDMRYEMADEYLDLVTQLWASWDPDAVVRDVETGTYAEYRKVRTIDFAGTYFSSRVPLNTGPSPQGRPVLCQPGSSPKARALAAKYADTVVAPFQPVESMKAYRDDIRSRLEAIGRKPDDCNVLFMASPTHRRRQ